MRKTISTRLGDYQLKGVEGIADEFECSKAKVLRVAVSTLFYFLHEEQGGHVKWFHIQEKLRDPDR